MKKIIFIYILLAAGLTSCGVIQYVDVPVDYAPKLAFKPDTTTIVILNRFAFDSVRVRSKKKLGLLRAGGYSSLAGVARQLNMLPGVNTIILTDSAGFSVNTDSVRQLTAKYKADYILTLDTFDVAVLRQYEQGDYGITAYYNTVIKLNFTLYEKSGLYKKLSGVTEEPTEMVNNDVSINAAARNAALDALKDYLPSTLWHNRPLFDNNDKLRASALQIIKGRFDIAYSILNPMIDGSDAKLASRAAYNLAIVYEAQGDIDEALETAKLSNSKNQNEYAKVLIADLIKE